MDDYASQNSYNIKEYQDKAGNTQNEMAYDANGNLIKDLDRDIVAIRYNLLNLPEIIQFRNGNQIWNRYDASGRKLSSINITVFNNTTTPIVAENTIRDYYLNDEALMEGTFYFGNVEYGYYGEFVEGILEYEDFWISKLNNPEGYCGDLEYNELNYYRKDHLGNIREVWRAPYSINGYQYPAYTQQYTQYYPSGLPWQSNSGDNPGYQQRKYNGKEWVEMHGLDETDLGWRYDYNATNRFITRDRKAEEFPWQTPYCVANNNTIKFIDKKGEGAGEPDSGGTPANETKFKIVFAQSTARINIPEKVMSIQLTPSQITLIMSKNTPIGTISSVPSKYEQQYNLHTPLTLKPLIESPVIRAIATGGLAITLTPSLASLKLSALNTTINTLKTVNTVYNTANMTAVGLQAATGSTAIVVGATTGTIQSFLPYDAPAIKINPIIDGWSNTTQLIWGAVNTTNNSNR